MEKIYSKKNKGNKNNGPSEKCIQFILDYSKAMDLVKSEKILIEINKN
jgi:hypothetical protein